MSAPESRPSMYCAYCLGRRMRVGNCLEIVEEGQPPRAMHINCLVRWIQDLPSGPQKRELQESFLVYLSECKARPQRDMAPVREALRAKLDAMPEPTVPQHPIGYVPPDEET